MQESGSSSIDNMLEFIIEDKDLKKEDIDLIFAKHWLMYQTELWLNMEKMMYNIVPKLNDISLISRIGILDKIYRTANSNAEQEIRSNLEKICEEEDTSKLLQVKQPTTEHKDSHRKNKKWTKTQTVVNVVTPQYNPNPNPNNTGCFRIYRGMHYPVLVVPSMNNEEKTLFILIMFERYKCFYRLRNADDFIRYDYNKGSRKMDGVYTIMQQDNTLTQQYINYVCSKIKKM